MAFSFTRDARPDDKPLLEVDVASSDFDLQDDEEEEEEDEEATTNKTDRK